MILEIILAAGSLTVRMPATAEISGTAITLGEIAQLSGDEELVRAAGELALGYSPAPGFSRLLLAERVKVQLDELLPSASIALSGEASCRVTPLVEEIAAASISAAASRDIHAVFQGLDVEITQEGSVADLRVPRGEVAARLVPVLQRRDQRPGSWSVPVQVLVDGGVYQTVWTRWNVGLWSTQQVLTRAVQRGEKLVPSDFRVQRVQLGSGMVEPPIDVDLVGGATARHDLPLGSMVSMRDLERPRVIERDALVTLEVCRGAITARMPVLVLDGGRVGDHVKVRGLEREHEMSAVIINRDLVRINLK